MNNYFLPEGFKDFLPNETEKLRNIESQLLSLYKKKGYQEVVTPTLDYFDNLTRETGETINDEMISFVWNGKLMALRAEMTTPIARLVAQKMRNESLPLRLSYSSQVFREEVPFDGQNKEFTQIGIEFIGANSVKSDAEVISLFIDSFKASGLKDFKIFLGQAAIFSQCLIDAGLDESSIQKIILFASRRNIVNLEKTIRDTKIATTSKNNLLKLYSLAGGEEIISTAEKLITSQSAWQILGELVETFKIIKEEENDKFLLVDLGLIRDFSYYTGIVFEGYISELGSPVGGGGRYDNLLAEFGFPQPAAGFALGAERLLLALRKQRNNSVFEKE